MDSLALLWVLAICCILMASVSGADTFSVCSNCDCKQLPGTLDGRMVDVPASIAETDWFVFNDSIKSNATAVLLFRSVDPSCNVEIKLKGINTTVQFLVYPSGREDPTIASVDLGPFDAPCRVESPSLLSLGTSVVSKGTELAIAFVKVNALTRVAVDVQILYRQHCSATRAVEGLPIAPPPLNGSAQPLQLANIGSLVPGGYGTNITWSIPPPQLSCAMKLQFNRISSIFATLNGLHVFVGITYRIPQGREAVIRAFPSDVVINLEYRAVDCGAPIDVTQTSSSKLQIDSWNDVVKPLRLVQVPIGGDPWQTINVTLPDDDRHRIGIWFLSGPELAYVPFTSWHSGHNWLPDLPKLYLEDFNIRFNSTIMPGSVPFVSFYKDPQPRPLSTLTYAFLPAAASPMLVATANSSAPVKLVFTKDMLAARKIYIKSNNESCGVAVWRSGESAALRKIRLLPYGFDSPFNDFLDVYDQYYGDRYVGSKVQQWPTRSVGSVMGIEFYAWENLETNSVGIFYQMVCPILLNTAVHPGQWHYVYFPSDRPFLLPKPPVGRNQCRVEVSSVASALLLQQNPSVPSLSVLVTCLESPVRAEMLSGHKTTSAKAHCNGALAVDVYSRHIPRNNTMFAYRVRCGEDDRLGIDDGMAPFLPMKKTFRADEKWKTLDTGEYEYEDTRRVIWMLQARDPKCRVEISIDKTRDLASINILEDFMEDLDAPVFAVEYGVKIKHIRYVSCGPRLFLVGLQPGIGKRNTCKYRQVCDGDASGMQCTQRVTVEPSSDGKWNTLQATSNGNLNQLRQLQYHIASHRTYNDTGKLLELEFTSIVPAESWAGVTVRNNFEVAETHSIWINGNLRATAGKQYLFRESADITVDSLLRTKRGDHLFTARYRLVDAKQARQEVRLGDVLTATNKAKILEFNIPQQFSTKALQAIRKHLFTRHEDASDGVSWSEAGDFPVWFFRHLYAIVPSNASCSIALDFTLIDIGSGHFCGGECGYSNEQHRLSVTSFLSGTPRTSRSCISSSLDDPVLTPNKTICARMDRTYVTAPGSTLALRFASINVPEYEYGEYEYERDLAFLGYSGPELTFGSGWTATYRQICDPIKAVTLGIPQIIPVKARRMRRAKDWQVGLPGMFQSNKNRLFRAQRWLITAEQPGCAVQYVVVAKTNRWGTMPARFQVGDHIIVPRANETVISGNVTIIQLGSSRTNPVTIKYRQMCTGRPTSSPTPSPIPVASGLDGDTCVLDQQCASGICSKILLRCTSNTCSPQCASKNGNQTKCKSYVANGCSCAWSTTGSLCIPVT